MRSIDLKLFLLVVVMLSFVGCSSIKKTQDKCLDQCFAGYEGQYDGDVSRYCEEQCGEYPQ